MLWNNRCIAKEVMLLGLEKGKWGTLGAGGPTYAVLMSMLYHHDFVRTCIETLPDISLMQERGGRS